MEISVVHTESGMRTWILEIEAQASNSTDLLLYLLYKITHTSYSALEDNSFMTIILVT